ncbi:MAG: hypothetical protein JSS68_04220 [Actinobacteria bacterium]|nr:hypothetical protein [Actinomycetota bacterium]
MSSARPFTGLGSMVVPIRSVLSALRAGDGLLLEGHQLPATLVAVPANLVIALQSGLRI